MELLHKTPVEDIPGAIASFQGRVLIGIGKYLRIYDLGKKKLLRKCENKVCIFICDRNLRMGNVECFVFNVSRI